MQQILTFLKEKKCTILNVIYQLAFAGTMFGGGEYYLTQIQEAKEAMENLQATIVQQVDRAETLVNNTQRTVKQTGQKINQSANKVANAGEQLTTNVNKIEDALKQVEKTCKGGGLF